MPRIRYLKPGFFNDVDLAPLKPLARLMFAGLWCYADREGRLEDKPAQLKHDILPFDKCDPEGLLAALAEGGFIIRYEAGDARRLIQIAKFTEHQRPHKNEPASTLPAPNGYVPARILREAS